MRSVDEHGIVPTAAEPPPKVSQASLLVQSYLLRHHRGRRAYLSVGSQWSLFTIAVLFFLARIAIRFKVSRCLYFDDAWASLAFLILLSLALVLTESSHVGVLNKTTRYRTTMYWEGRPYMYGKVNLPRHAKPKRGSVLTKECQHRQCHQGMWGTLNRCDTLNVSGSQY